MSAVKRFFRAYWAILSIIPVAVGIGVVLAAAGHPWSAQDWGANVGLGFFVTAAGVILARRQGDLQESLADLEIIEKVAVLSGTIDRIEFDPSASRMCQAMNDARAALSLAPLAAPGRQAELLETLDHALGQIRYSMRSTTDLLVYCLWDSTDWRRTRESLQRLQSTLIAKSNALKPSPQSVLPSHLVSQVEALISDASPSLSLEAFGQAFRRRIRVSLDWAQLAELDRQAEAKVRVDVVRLNLLDDSFHAESYYAPWYSEGEGGQSCGWDNSDAVPLSYRAMAGSSRGLTDRQATRIGDRMDLYRAHDPHVPSPLAIPTLDLGNGKRIVLDGNHRLVAALRDPNSSHFLRIAEFRVSVGADVASVLPDVAAHRRTLDPA